MNLKRIVTTTAGLLAGVVLWAQKPDPLGESLFPPELILQQSEAIGLTEEQKGSLMSELQAAQDRFAEMHEKLQAASDALAALLKKQRVAEAEALAQFDKVLQAERDIKRAHLALVLSLKNKLSAEQQAKLQAIKIKMQEAAQAEEAKAAARARNRATPPARLPQKMEKLQAGVKRLQEEGGDVSAIGGF
jgi:ParB-like chromosome segregation protein Spo0J